MYGNSVESLLKYSEPVDHPPAMIKQNCRRHQEIFKAVTNPILQACTTGPRCQIWMMQSPVKDHHITTSLI
jgi:protein tyrosine phosphatase (PTP) superfamily phosphohydrolase (DUF442 family)